MCFICFCFIFGWYLVSLNDLLGRELNNMLNKQGLPHRAFHLLALWHSAQWAEVSYILPSWKATCWGKVYTLYLEAVLKEVQARDIDILLLQIIIFPLVQICADWWAPYLLALLPGSPSQNPQNPATKKEENLSNAGKLHPQLYGLQSVNRPRLTGRQL